MAPIEQSPEATKVMEDKLPRKFRVWSTFAYSDNAFVFQMDVKDYGTTDAGGDLSANDRIESLELVPTHLTESRGPKVDRFPTSDFPDRLAEQVSYGPGGVRGIISNPYCFGAAFLASLGGFSFGYDQGVISVINVMPQFHETYTRLDPEASSAAFWKGFMTGMLELGAFLGCFGFPSLADRISRKWAISVVALIFNIGAIMQTAAPNYAVLVAGRTITGVGVGTLALGAPLYISEISVPELRGALLVLESLAIMVSAVSLGIGIHFFPYSPRWLALVSRKDDSLASLAKLRRLPRTDNRVLTEWHGILAEAEVQKLFLEKAHPGLSGLRREFATWMDLFKRKAWRRTAVGIGVAFFQQFSGVNAFIYYAPTLFTALGQKDLSLILAGTLNIGQMFAVIMAFFIIDKVGRRQLAIWGAVAMGLPYVFIAILYGLYSYDWLAHPAAGWAAVAMAYLYILGYGVSYSSLGWVLPSEVYSTAQRSKGAALSTAVNWISNCIVGIATPPMIEDAGFGTYVFFACMCLLAVIWAYFLVPETKGKTLEELDEILNDNAGKEEHEIMRGVAAEATTWKPPLQQTA
ncbi:hexose carrier protein [Hortaea werneckii]|nr:hexose carrier protein [Hortaea werneckii]KAI7722670.1 hexose carrier protein [Hortaea werneckii]